MIRERSRPVSRMTSQLKKGDLIQGYRVGSHVRGKGVGRGATWGMIERTIVGARAAGTVLVEAGTGRFAGHEIRVFVHGGVKVVVDITDKTIMTVRPAAGGFRF